MFEKSRYSVPTRDVNPKAVADVRADSKLLRIYVKGELVKIHARKASGSSITGVAAVSRSSAHGSTGSHETSWACSAAWAMSSSHARSSSSRSGSWAISTGR